MAAATASSEWMLLVVFVLRLVSEIKFFTNDEEKVASSLIHYGRC